MEASTNLIGGQPFSIQNMREVRRIADKYGLRLVLDASLLGENAYLILQREPEFAESTMGEVIEIMTHWVQPSFSFPACAEWNEAPSQTNVTKTETKHMLIWNCYA
jgi:hypothetical protein